MNLQERLDLLQEKTRVWAEGENVKWVDYREKPMRKDSYSQKRFIRGKMRRNFYGV